MLLLELKKLFTVTQFMLFWQAVGLYTISFRLGL